MAVSVRQLEDPRLPSLESLLSRDPEGLVRLLDGLGIRIDMASIQHAADVLFERMAASLRAGVVLDDVAWSSFDAQLERAVSNVLRMQVKNAVRDYRMNQLQDFAEPYIWITVADDRVCGSCEPRHGEENLMGTWERLGLPGAPNLDCTANCRCQVLPLPPGDGRDVYVGGGIL